MAAKVRIPHKGAMLKYERFAADAWGTKKEGYSCTERTFLFKWQSNAELSSNN
jgi:hypothetical protein